MPKTSARFLTVAVIASALALLALQCGSNSEDGGFVPIFNGIDLEGWEIRSGHASYEVEDGVIVGTTVEDSPNTFLCTKKEYGDFVLVFDVKVDPLLNSGVQIRSHEYESPTTVWMPTPKGLRERSHPAGRVYGYQVEIANEQGGASGGVYDEARRGWLHNIADDPISSKAFKDNQWNEYRVEAEGDSIKVWVNGVPCADFVDPLDLSGFIGLQVHGYKGLRPAQVRWRDIRIQEMGRHVWEPLWDGKGFDGWNPRGGGKWYIQAGVIHANGVASGGGGLLVSAQEFSDFTIRLKFQAVKGNSGLLFRMGTKEPEQEGDEPTLESFEAEIDEAQNVGGLFAVGGREWVGRPDQETMDRSFKPGDWNEMVVSARERRIAIFLNGVKTVDVTDDPGRLSGRLALQIPGGQDVEMLFKDIEILRKASDPGVKPAGDGQK